MKAVHSLGVKSLPFGKEIPRLFQLLCFGEWVWSKGKLLGPNKVLKFKKKRIKNWLRCTQLDILFQSPACELALILRHGANDHRAAKTR